MIRRWTRYTVSQLILMLAHARICLDSVESGGECTSLTCSAKSKFSSELEVT